MTTPDIQCLLSLPQSSVAYLSTTDRFQADNIFIAADPPGGKLGSGGGTAHMLAEGWRATGDGASFSDWLAASRKLIILGGGQSRRLPAYAPVGKPFIPMPILQGSWGQSLDQTLMDLQVETYRGVLERAPGSARVLVASGDVMLRFAGRLPAVDNVDLLMLGMRVDAEIATHFGVFFMSRSAPDRLAFMLQKPPAEKIRELARDYHFVVDTGMWLLGEKAVGVLIERCGWDAAQQRFRSGTPDTYELYMQFGLALGDAPTQSDHGINALSCSVQALPEPEFYHLGTSRQMIQSVCDLQNRQVRQFMAGAARAFPNQVIQNSDYVSPDDRQAHRTLWIENATIPPAWQLAYDHVLTGVPDNEWDVRLEPGACLDFVGIGEEAFCVRTYGMDDPFSGGLGDAATLWLGARAGKWFEARHIEYSDAELDPAADIYRSKLFPILTPAEISTPFLEWLFAADPVDNPDFAKRWREATRLSAEEINFSANLARIEGQRAAHRRQSLLKLYKNRRFGIFFHTDLGETARLFAEGNDRLPAREAHDDDPMDAVHDHMWRAAVLCRREKPGAEEEEAKAFARLRESILEAIRAAKPDPACAVLSDQIIWARSPARLDFAGGWTDTPPYCLLHGGQVVNAAVNLNGQPPIQVFAKLSEKPEIVLRSIDLGIEQRITTHAELAAYDRIGTGFTLAKAALALAGFLPAFYGGKKSLSLEKQLKEFGGGIELSLVAAIPQGSGLGTSSIMGATLLGALNALCGLKWDTQAIMTNTLAIEQMLTTGGGWQDQAGGVLKGVKHCLTRPGFSQEITTRWLPEPLIANAAQSGRTLLYYTGITRLAKNILQEIVRGMFLNSAGHLAILAEIGANAESIADAIQRNDWDDFAAGIRRSWALNQRLDAGTNPPAIQRILDPIKDLLAAVKLSGAGGGGYMMLLAKDEQAGAKIRKTLEAHAPNNKSRFVDFSISPLGMEVTRS